MRPFRCTPGRTIGTRPQDPPDVTRTRTRMRVVAREKNDDRLKGQLDFSELATTTGTGKNILFPFNPLTYLG